MKLINITEESLKDTFCFGDLYKKLGIIEMSERRGGFIRSIEQIRANKKTIDYLHDLFIKVVQKSKDKRVKFLTKEYKERAVAWDFLLWAPTTDESIPDMQIGLDENKDKYDKVN